MPIRVPKLRAIKNRSRSVSLRMPRENPELLNSEQLQLVPDREALAEDMRFIFTSAFMPVFRELESLAGTGAHVNGDKAKINAYRERALILYQVVAFSAAILDMLLVGDSEASHGDVVAAAMEQVRECSDVVIGAIHGINGVRWGARQFKIYNVDAWARAGAQGRSPGAIFEAMLSLFVLVDGQLTLHDRCAGYTWDRILSMSENARDPAATAVIKDAYKTGMELSNYNEPPGWQDWVVNQQFTVTHGRHLFPTERIDMDVLPPAFEAGYYSRRQ